MQTPSHSDTSEREPQAPAKPAEAEVQSSEQLPREHGGRRDGLEPTRYGDWEKNGRCIDF